MFFNLALQDEFLGMPFAQQQVLDNTTLMERANLHLPLNFEELIKKNKDSQYLQQLWKTFLGGNGYKYQRTKFEINNIDNENDIKKFIDLYEFDVLLLEEEISEIYLDRFLKVLIYNEKEACAPRYSAIQKTKAFEKIDALFQNRKLTNGPVIWKEHIKPFISNARKVTVVDRHLASYLYGSQRTDVKPSKHILSQRSLVKKLLSEFQSLSGLEQLDLVCEYRERDFLGDISYAQVPDNLKKLKNILSSKGLNVNFFLGPEKFFQDEFKESIIGIDSKYCLTVGHFGDLFSKAKNKRQVMGSKIDDGNRHSFSKIGKPYKDKDWIKI